MSENPQRYSSRVIELRQVSDRGYELMLERAGLTFQTGQELMLHGDEPSDDRQYSIASGEADEQVTILFRLIPEGMMTPKLVAKRPGDTIEFTGPFGSFVIRDFLSPMLFIATGTGVAPALSFVRTHSGLGMTLLHGVREEQDLFGRELLEAECAPYIPCISQQPDSMHFQGRVTAKLAEMEWEPDTHFYLCGSNDMILEVRRQLRDRNVEDDSIVSEAYYFW